MAESIKQLSSVRIKFSLDMVDGKLKTKSKTFSNLKNDATNDDVYSVCTSIANLCEYDLIDIIKQDYTSLRD